MRHAVEQPPGIGILNAILDETESRPAAVRGEIRFLDRSGVIVREAVDTDDRRPLVEEHSRQMRADEAGAAGH